MRSGTWTADEVDELRRRYPDERTQDIAVDLDRNLVSVYSKAQALGLEKSDVFKNSETSGRLQKGTTAGAAFRFKKGEGSKRKGQRFPARGRSMETQFKPGHKPHNWAPIGSERLCEGYLQRKMTDTGYPPRDWKFVHRLVWEEHHGPIPKRHVVVFRNGDRQDVRVQNLELISRADLQRRNSVHNLPEPIREVIALRGQIVRQINKRTGCGKEQD